VTRTAQSASAAIDRIAAGTDGWVAMGDFVDDWNRSNPEERAAMIQQSPPVGPKTRRWVSLVAAAVDYLGRSSQPPVDVPGWALSPDTVLDEPWFLIPGTSLRMHQLVNTPAAFKSRNIFGGDRILSRV
jgi:hypothetical protein